jgi:hypothetical protein
MNYCARCKRYLNGALSCAGCGMMVGGSDDHPTLPLPKIRVQEMVPLPEPTGPKVQLPPDGNAPQAAGPLAAGPNQTAAPISSPPGSASAQVPESALEQTRQSAPVPAATPAAPPTPDSAPAQEHAPVWVGASDAILKFESDLASGLTPMPRPKSKPKPRPQPEQASPTADNPSSATDPEEARPTSIPVPVPLSIPNSPHPLATAAAAAGTPKPANSDEYIKLGEVGIGLSGTAGHRSDDERSHRGLSRKSTGVLVGTAAVVAVVAGAVVFSSSPASPKASTPPSQTGLVVLPTMAATGPQVVTDRQSGAVGQSAAPDPTTARTAVPSASATPTVGNGPDIIAPSQTPTPTTIPKAPKTTSPPVGDQFTVTASKYSNSRNVGTETTTDTGGGQDVGWITNGSWLAYDGIDFPSGMTGRIQVRLASFLTSSDVGTIQFRLNSPYASAFATVTVNGTGGWQNWTTTSTGESPIPSGTYTLYVTFSTWTGGDFVNVNWFQFS